MSLFSLFFRDNLASRNREVAQKAVIDEFDNLTSATSAWALAEHNENGSHNVRPQGIDFIPVGGMVRWPLNTAPTGWLLCNGAAVSRAAYPLLFSTIGITSGAGDGSTTFNVPNVANYIILAI